MKISASYTLKLKVPEVQRKVRSAVQFTLRDIIIDIHGEALENSPYRHGHNRRSMASEVSGMGAVVLGEDATYEKVVNDNKLEAAFYTTSGYGGFLEVGTKKMRARPYIKPAADKFYTAEIYAEKIKEYLEDDI